MKLKTLIADDEPLARERLKFLLSAEERIDFVEECRNGKEVIAALRAQQFDVLFLDIQMPGIDGFDVIEQIGPVHMPVTVFVTAHNHYAVKAFEVHALDYLTKPIEPERLRETLVRVRERLASKAALVTQEQLRSALVELDNGNSRRKTYPKRILVHDNGKDVLVVVSDIEWIEAADYYSCLHVGTKTFLLRETIKQLVDTLDPERRTSAKLQRTLSYRL